MTLRYDASQKSNNKSTKRPTTHGNIKACLLSPAYYTHSWINKLYTHESHSQW